ncbi:hypothetical protein AXG93_685s1090 [Marchantia polymorpha subsp. ruderalis]|uniref:Uncharacterized protein n=1 Tax=Marchantia polymorpha subsp. ruderalis TaxID=1480154 RepID=A0A176WGX5_MARPO|nr:hypothetical protein AXG93_685s1090 [Marchantia polymorpha subsp. ruderalis]
MEGNSSDIHCSSEQVPGSANHPRQTLNQLTSFQYLSRILTFGHVAFGKLASQESTKNHGSPADEVCFIAEDGPNDVLLAWPYDMPMENDFT